MINLNSQNQNVSPSIVFNNDTNNQSSLSKNSNYQNLYSKNNQFKIRKKDFVDNFVNQSPKINQMKGRVKELVEFENKQQKKWSSPLVRMTKERNKVNDKHISYSKSGKDLYVDSKSLVLNKERAESKIEFIERNSSQPSLPSINLPTIKAKNKTEEKLKYDFKLKNVKDKFSFKIINSIANSDENPYRKPHLESKQVSNVNLNDFIDTPNVEIYNSLKKEFANKHGVDMNQLNQQNVQFENQIQDQFKKNFNIKLDQKQIDKLKRNKISKLIKVNKSKNDSTSELRSMSRSHSPPDSSYEARSNPNKQSLTESSLQNPKLDENQDSDAFIRNKIKLLEKKKKEEIQSKNNKINRIDYESSRYRKQIQLDEMRKMSDSFEEDYQQYISPKIQSMPNLKLKTEESKSVENDEKSMLKDKLRRKKVLKSIRYELSKNIHADIGISPNNEPNNTGERFMDYDPYQQNSVHEELVKSLSPNIMSKNSTLNNSVRSGNSMNNPNN